MSQELDHAAECSDGHRCWRDAPAGLRLGSGHRVSVIGRRVTLASDPVSVRVQLVGVPGVGAHQRVVDPAHFAPLFGRKPRALTVQLRVRCKGMTSDIGDCATGDVIGLDL